MKEVKIQIKRKERRTRRVRASIGQKSSRLRLSVFRSNAHFYAQIIDDSKGLTLLGISEKDLKGGCGNKIERAGALGRLMAEKAKEKKILEVAFDKGPYKYHGRVKSFADGAREGGLKF